jgi:hypothetical protein
MKEKILFFLVLSIFFSFTPIGFWKSEAADCCFLYFKSSCLPEPPGYKAWNNFKIPLNKDIASICTLLLEGSTDRGEVEGPGFDEEEDEEDEPEEPEEPEEDDAKVFIG